MLLGLSFQLNNLQFSLIQKGEGEGVGVGRGVKSVGKEKLRLQSHLFLFLSSLTLACRAVKASLAAMRLLSVSLFLLSSSLCSPGSTSLYRVTS